MPSSSRSPVATSGRWNRVRRSAAIARQEFRLLRNDPGQAIALAVIPVLLMAIIKGPVGIWLTIETGRPSTGAELAVPGQAALASYLAMVNFGIFFYRDFGTGVWDRLRVGSARPVEIVAGKLAANWVVFFLQFMVAFVLGGALSSSISPVRRSVWPSSPPARSPLPCPSGWRCCARCSPARRTSRRASSSPCSSERSAERSAPTSSSPSGHRGSSTSLRCTGRSGPCVTSTSTTAGSNR